MACTAPCGGGSRRRYILCLKNETVVEASQCDKEEKPADSEDCNKEPCDKEGFVPMSGCASTKFGCCSDGTTPADGINANGCPQSDAGIPCVETEFGCCPDNVTVALGPYGSGCKNVTDDVANINALSIPLFPLDGNITLDSSNITLDSNSTADSSSTSINNSTSANTTDILLSITNTTDLAVNATAVNDSSVNVTTSTAISLNVTGINDTADALDLDNVIALDNSTALDSSANTTDIRINATASAQEDGDLPLFSSISFGLNDSTNATDCALAEHGCCADNTTAATGPNQLGCDEEIEGSSAECQASEHGCCPDGKTVAKGPNNAGCDKKAQGECKNTEFGCCSDGETAALGRQWEGCPEADCANSYHGCCPDGLTQASGPNYEECPHTKQSKQVCELHSDGGPCRSNYTIKWHYDSEYGDCNRFWYGGCEGNENRFDSEEACQGDCITPRGVEVCNLPKVRGPCDQNLRMWYYDKYVRECLPFHYGGCLGNDNRFESREDCNERCVETQIPDICQQPVRQGKCPGQIPRWYFDKASGRCNEYLYSGCGGNGNRFMSDDQCLKKCSANGGQQPTDMCVLEKEEGNCKDYYPRFYFNRDTRTCEQFIYTGCNGNENRFESVQECHQSCSRYLAREPQRPDTAPAPTVNPAVQHCFLPSDRGICERSLPRWHYDSSDGVCKRFLFSGCGGNTNNFETNLQCLTDCSSAQDRCDLPKVVGPCRGALNVYYFDKYERRCLQFAYGGCQGNGNRFQSSEECERNCSHAMYPPTAPPWQDEVHTIQPDYEVQTYPSAQPSNPYLAICSMAVDAGACDERIARYYYDISQGKCLSFTYTGCGGNQNHFHTLEQCESFCSQFGVGCPARTCDTQCPHGYENDPSSCPTCRCLEPCRDIQCPAHTVCNVQVLTNGEKVGVCASKLEKAGTCPSLEDIPPGTCSRNCDNDNECPGMQKCCSNGCGTACMTPVELVDQHPALITPAPTFFEPPTGGEQYPAVIQPGLPEVHGEPGQSVTLPCQAMGDPEPQVFWTHNNNTVRLDDSHYTQRHHSLVIQEVRSKDAGDYVCFANNGLGPSSEQRVRLIIESLVRIDGADVAVNARKGDRAILKCVAHGMPQPTTSWSKGGEALLRDSARHRQMGDGSLLIEDVNEEDQSVYICTADNGVHAPAVRNVVLRVHEEIKAQIVASSSNFQAGSMVRLDCRANGYPMPRVRWYLNAQEIVSDGDRSQVFSNGTLIVKKVRASDAGVYQCQASNEHSSGTDSLRIFITGAPLARECTDNEYYANCKLIVVAELCSNEYYAKFCCKSCTEAGQARPSDYRRRRKRSLRASHFL